MDLEKQKENFKNHIATLIDYGNIKILDFKEPNSSHYRIRFLFEEDYCRLHISGDLGELIATNYNNMTYEKFSDFVNNVGYFEQKINCHNRRIYAYDEDKLEEFYEDVLEDFSQDNGIGSKGYDALSEYFNDVWEFVSDIGKRETGILDLYMLAFKLAQEQLNSQSD